ncbi:MAG: FAD-dependent monooxygenase [Candidatus Obscuribacterales bacterium]|nr:FAD-dependent monooxygenase [Candidatus Obscuribacterales bacterium]
MIRSFDAAIIGGGPAGSATAVGLAKRGLKVALFEKNLGTPWKIGESLPPEARPLLQKLGAWERFCKDEHLSSSGIVSQWGGHNPVEKDYIFNPNGSGWHVDRSRFESNLLELAQHCSVAIFQGKEPEKFDFSNSGHSFSVGAERFQSDWIVDCSGRKAQFATSVSGPYQKLDAMVSIFVLFRSKDKSDVDARTFVESCEDGWWYSALMPSGVRIVAYQTDQDLLPEQESITNNWIDLKLEQTSKISNLLSQHSCKAVSAPRIVSAHAGRFDCFVGKTWISVGDSAMTFDPLSGLGSYKALLMASAAVEHLTGGPDYQQFCEQLWTNFLEQRLSYYESEKRWHKHAFWKRRRLK